jgi:hypothetical protein
MRNSHRRTRSGWPRFVPVSKPDHHDGLPTRHVRIAAVAGGAVLIIGLAVAIGTASGSRPKPHHTGAAPAPSTSAPSVPPPVTSGPPATPAPTAVPSTPPVPAPVVRWHGRLTVDGPDADRDLDSVPPRTSDHDADLTGSTFETTLTGVADGVQFATLTGKSGFPQCRDAVVANGTDHTGSLHDGDMVCVLTSQGRVARLRVLHAALGFPAATIKADVTVWDPPQPRG